MQPTSPPRWLMIASSATAVFPVPRSPMISSRWPRPTFVIESIAFMPGVRGSFPRWAWVHAGRLRCARAAPAPHLAAAGRAAVPQPVRAGEAAPDRQDCADLREVGLDVVGLDPL